MYEEINKEIIEVKERLRKKEKLQIMLELSEESLGLEKDKAEGLIENISRIEKEIQMLHSFSMGALVHSLIGSKKEKIKALKQEFSNEKHRCDELLKYINKLENDVISYKERLKEYRFEEDRLRYLIERKAQVILQAGDDNSKELAPLMEEAAELELRIAELEETIKSGKNVVECLQGAIWKLKNARFYGSAHLDDGDAVTSYLRQSMVDDSREYLFAARMAIAAFKRELEDINIYKSIYLVNVHIDKDSNYLLDGFIKDITIQGQIRSSIDSLKETMEKVRLFLQQLEIWHEKSIVRLAEVKPKLEYILQSAR